MRWLSAAGGFFLLLLTACGGVRSIPGNIPTVPPTSTPRVIAPTGTIIWMTPTGTSTVTPVSPLSSSTPTFLPSATLTGTSTSFTPGATPTDTSTPLAPLNAVFSGCNTSMDITHSMGEVTNAYITIRNSGSVELNNICATLSASDEDRTHPDRTRCIQALPSGYQVMLKLTVDTGYQQDTAIQVELNTSQGIVFSAYEPSCVTLGLPGWVPGKVDLLEAIP